MIYNKEVAFPYPVLMAGTNNYKDEDFYFDIDVTESTDDFMFKYNFELSSDFIKNLILNNSAQAILIIQSKDNKFFKLDSLKEKDDKYHGILKISKKRLSLNKKTKLQIFIQSQREINYAENNDLLEFYDEIKKELNITKNSAIAISNEVVFDGSSKNPTELFEKKLDENLDSAIAIELSKDSIIIKYKSPDYQFQTLNSSKALNYPYIYMGLQKALMKFILDINIEKGADFDEPIDISEIKHNDLEGLNFKLISLMSNKGVSELNFDNIDNVIYKISDNIIDKYTLAIKRMSEDGN